MAEDFWADNRTAQTQMQQLTALREEVSTWENIAAQLDDLQGLAQLLEEEPDEEMQAEVAQSVATLEQEVEKLHANGIRFKVVGDLAPFDARIVSHIRRGEALTRDNRRLTLTVAANYGGRWDILQAANRCREEDPNAPITEEQLTRFLSMSYAPEPDLFIRTGGEERVSNFLLWQLAYTELYFTDALWPDFGAEALDAAIASYRRRERRFGRTSEQLREGEPVPQTG